MVTQTAITEKTIEKEADYIFAVKENQRQLYTQNKEEFRFAKN